MLAGAPAEAAAQSAAAAQGMIGLSSLTEAGQIGGAGLLGLTGGLQASQAIALNGTAALGLFGPVPGITPANAAINVQYANLANATLGQLAAITAAQALLGLGSSAMLANSGRHFLLSTYYGVI